MADNAVSGDGNWHLDKRISVGHIITTGVVACALVTWLMQTEANVGLNAQAISHLERRIESSERRSETVNAEIKAALVRIESKLDRKADK